MELVIIKLFLCSALGLVVGNFVCKRYRQKRVYYEEILNLICRIESDLSFVQSKISDLFSSLDDVRCEELKVHCQEFKKVVSGEDSELTRFNFSSDEYSEISSFFSSLGTSDLSTQLSQLKYYKDKFTVRFENSKNCEKSKGKPSVKLGFFMGLAVGIVIL